MRRAAPAFEILMLAPVRRFFPEPRQRLNGGWHRSRVLHPSEDLSELPPLRSVVAGQVYHYRLAGSSQNSLPKLLPARWDRSSPYWAVFMLEHRSCTGGLRASSASLFHFWLIRLMSFSRWICTFQAARGGLKKIPSCGRQRERAFYAVFNYFFKKFFKREILREILYCFPYPICSKSDCVKP